MRQQLAAKAQKLKRSRARPSGTRPSASKYLQQVFENVVKHNELSIEKPMSISMVIENDFLVVSNTLHPKLTVETSKPSGLENINSRYAYFTDEKVTVIKTVNVFTIKLPLLKPEL